MTTLTLIKLGLKPRRKVQQLKSFSLENFRNLPKIYPVYFQMFYENDPQHGFYPGKNV